MRADPRELAAVFAGGALGALARALLEDALSHAPGTWPWATFAVNVAGALLLGYAVTRLQERLPFSAFQVELLQMLDAGHAALALGYATASIAAGAVAVALATNLVRRARVAP